MEKQLTLNEYQELAMKTCMQSCDNFSYMMLNLVGEVGELASKVAKDIRKRQVTIGDIENDLTPEMPYDEWEARDAEYMHEAGDILWQLAGLCTVMGWDLNAVGNANLTKLASRAERNKIVGDGDNR
jgi:NTP pyrophosphatase (non-canonical NTP hydrolase)